MKDLILKYRDKSKYDYSCSETMMIAANEYYDLGLNENAFKMMAPFSGGMLEEEVCGVVTGALAVLGILFTKGVAHTSDVLKDAVLEYKSEFRNMHTTQECSILKQLDRQKEGCTDLIVEGAKLLEDIIKKYGKQV